MQKAFTIYGPPALLFFKNGKELSEFRLVGFKNADEFLAHLEKSQAPHNLLEVSLGEVVARAHGEFTKDE